MLTIIRKIFYLGNRRFLPFISFLVNTFFVKQRAANEYRLRRALLIFCLIAEKSFLVEHLLFRFFPETGITETEKCYSS